MALLHEFVDLHSESAFAELARHHLNLVYSIALRSVGNAADAQDVTQAVFIILAQKAPRLRHRSSLTGWLYETTRFTSARLLRTRTRQSARDQEAYMQSTLNEPEVDAAWRQLAPHLEEAMSRLAERDRTLLALRFYENQSGPEAAATLGINEAAAHKRVGRALEKLRKFFARRGITLSTLTIAAAVSANSVSAAPAGLAATISTVALTQGATAGSSTLALVKGALKVMAWTKMKLALVVGVSLVVAAGTTTLTVEKIHERQNEAWQLGQDTGAFLTSPPYRTIILPTLAAKRNPRYGTSGMSSARDGQVLGYNQSIANLVRFANLNRGWISDCRTVLAAEMPTNNYDFLSNLPVGAQAALRQAIQTKFHVAGRLETRETNVLFLTLKYPAAAGLRPSENPNGSGSSTGNGQIILTGATTQELTRTLENTCFIPVIDQTGLTNRYDFKIRWKPNYAPDGQSANMAALTQALQDQLGLDLVPGTAPVDMLVIEKVK